MTVLVTGSVGKISSRVATQLQALNLPFLVATRRSPSSIPFPATTFDWLDESTYTNPFTTSPTNISAVFLVPPEVQEPAPHVNAFIDLAISKGVKKFVLSAGTSAQKGGMFVGPVWSHLEDLSKSSDVKFAVIRPTWFMENFSELQHQRTIKQESAFYSAAEDGKMPVISADDIAASAVSFLSGRIPYDDKDHVVIGPELLAHDQIAGIFSEVLGRVVQHRRKGMEDMVKQYESVGLNALYANFLPYLEVTAKEGSEQKFWDEGDNQLEELTGSKGITFQEWAAREAKKGYWG